MSFVIFYVQKALYFMPRIKLTGTDSFGPFCLSPYEKELYQNICDIYLKYIAHIFKLYVFNMSVYVSYMYMLHICRIRSNIYGTYM